MFGRILPGDQAAVAAAQWLELDGLTHNKTALTPMPRGVGTWYALEDGQAMTRTIMTTCDNCGKDLDQADGWHLVLDTWFVPVKRIGHSMTLEHRVYTKPIDDQKHFAIVNV